MSEAKEQAEEVLGWWMEFVIRQASEMGRTPPGITFRDDRVFLDRGLKPPSDVRRS